MSNPHYRLQLQVKGSLITPVTINTPTTLSVAENRGTATYTVGLDEEPNNDVTVTVTADMGVTVNKSGGTPGPTQTLTFTAGRSGNWGTAQTITVTGVNDAVDNPGERTVSIAHAATSTDPNYVIADAGSVAVTVIDDDATTVTLAGTDGNVTKGGSKTFTVTLGRGLVAGERVAVPLTFSGTAARGTDYTVTGAATTGVTYANLNSGNARVIFTGPQSGATATTATLTLSAAIDNEAESGGETVVIGLGPLDASSGTGLGGGAAGTDSLADFSIDTTAPSLSSAEGSNTTLTLTYDEALDAGSVPAGAAFTVKVNGTAANLASNNPVAVSGSTVTLTLAGAVGIGKTVTVSYAVPTANPVQDSAGNAAAGFTDQSVTV
ncbi:MAG: SwmB domain-containing protein, partial [Cyanobacteria bacterium MAG IRC3_bin_20]|nr:SwmB domain-containing protein [Cyanobacteria bacterium MAG IRC3_bin_20]